MPQRSEITPRYAHSEPPPRLEARKEPPILRVVRGVCARRRKEPPAHRRRVAHDILCAQMLIASARYTPRLRREFDL